MQTRLYERFLSHYSADNLGRLVQSNRPTKTEVASVIGWKELFDSHDGESFNSGIYRLISSTDLEIWHSLISGAFPGFKGRIIPFGYDWLGRFFCIDKHRTANNQPLVLLFSPFSNEALEIPATLHEFHNSILVDQSEPALEITRFGIFINKNDITKIPYEECAEITVPLFLGGNFSIENMSLIDVKLYWEITAQIISQISSYPEGTSIRQVKVIKPN
jgi:hypothetical protein